MRVRDIMTAKPATASPDASVAHALNLMMSGGFHHLPIMSRSGHLVGIVTLRDCRIALNLPQITDETVLTHSKAKNIRLRDIMTTAPIVTSPDMEVFDAAMLMYENNINSLPVMLDETLVGIMTSSDLLVACIQIVRNQKVTSRTIP